jgi:TonB dependent receptor
VFGELTYHLEGAQMPSLHKLTVNLAARHERIESVGGTTNPHLAVSLQPISAASMPRASYGTSFRAPPINLLRPTQTIVNAFLIYPQFNNIRIPTDVIEGGNPTLRLETAKTLNLGLIIAPNQLPGSSLTVDHIQLRQSNVDLVLNPQGIVDGHSRGRSTSAASGRLPARLRAMPADAMCNAAKQDVGVELLVWCPAVNFAKSFEFGQDGIGRIGPHEGLGVLIVMFDELMDFAFQIRHRVEGAAADRALRDQPEPALDLIEPGGVRWACSERGSVDGIPAML